jgi:tetratricopeptide (TPR) repeat protein
MERAIALEPGNPEHVSLAALSAACFGRFDEALQLNRQAIDLDPLNADSWEALAETELNMGQLDQSAADSKKALELDLDHWASLINLSRIYLLQGRPQDALPEIETYTTLPTVRICMRLRITHLVGNRSRTPHCKN